MGRLKIALLLVGAISILVGISVLVVAARKQEAYVDRSIMSGTPCPLPCWQGITPGITTQQQALAILQQNQYIEGNTLVQAGNSQTGGATWHWKASGKRMQPCLSWQDGIVQEMTLGLTFDLSVEAVVNHFGPPTALLVNEGGQPENWYLIVDLYYPDRGLEFKAFTPEHSDSLGPSTEVGGVTAYTPQSVEDRIRAQYSSSQTLLAHVLDNVRPWRGFGNIFGLYYTGIEALSIGK